MKLSFVCRTCNPPRTWFTLFRYNLVSAIRPSLHHFSLSCFRSGETSHIRSCKSNIYRGDRWSASVRRGDYRLECLQASAHVRVHFGIDGRQRDNKAIRVREGYCNTRPNCLNYKRRGGVYLMELCFLKYESLESIFIR